MSKSSKYLGQPHDRLLAIVARLDPILNPHGFVFEAEHNAVSSGGPFSNGFYIRPPVKIGLIVRYDELGLPNYDYGKFLCGHDDLIKRLGRASESAVRFNEKQWAVETTDGRDIVDAVVDDIEKIILPTLLNDPAAYENAVTAAHKERLAGWGIKE
ncbi:MAG: hypothetical protein U0796_05395 [Gemmatales bacterium]